jgi:copper homeostasis protein
MPGVLEVIVTSAEEAREAEMGGADRLELVRAFEVGGLTPAPEIAEQVLAAVSIPVRVMLREHASMSADASEISDLRARARELTRLPIDGLVLGFVKNGSLDFDTMERVLGACGSCRVTLHRAFEHVGNAVEAIEHLKKVRQIDRILTSGGEGRWPQRRARLLEWQAAAAPDIKLLVGVGLRASAIAEMSQHSDGFEFHVGRAARAPQKTSGVVRREQVAKLKARL